MLGAIGEGKGKDVLPSPDILDLKFQRKGVVVKGFCGCGKLSSGLSVRKGGIQWWGLSEYILRGTVNSINAAPPDGLRHPAVFSPTSCRFGIEPRATVRKEHGQGSVTQQLYHLGARSHTVRQGLCPVLGGFRMA